LVYEVLDIIALAVEVSYATAQNRDNPGLQHILPHPILAALGLVIHVIPFELVTTRFPVPESPTAQNSAS
jgi:hypothetical protein